MATAKATRKSVQAIVEETTAGTPKDPSSGADFITLQEGFDASPARDQIENVELSPSVDTKAPILGLENPESSIGHYYRHSGVEATRPNYSLLLKGLLGATEDAIAEKVTDTGSTAGDSDTQAVIEVATGGGSVYERGMAVLIKDSTNGYLVRNVESISADTLTLLFNLGQTAPASGVSLGRPIFYKTNDEPPSLTHHIYRANGAAYEVLAGCKVVSGELSAEAGQPLNWSFALQGNGYYFDPIRIASTDQYLDFDIDGVTEVSVTVAVGLYRHPHELAQALQTSMNNAGLADNFTVKYNDQGANAGKFTIASDGSTLNLLWSTGTNTANTIGDVLGFTVSADDSGALTYTSDTVQDLSAPYSETSDSDTNPLIVKNNEILIGNFDRTTCAKVRSFNMNIENGYQKPGDICNVDGVLEQILESRTTSVSVVFTLVKSDAASFKYYREGDVVRFAYTGGTKVGGNWVPGKVVNACIVEARISEWKVADGDGTVTIEATLQAVGNASGLQNVFLNLL